ncbi:MAG TPA: hypothetical protein VGB55_02930, partial [Tepidisphaeraceae bacterium]
MNLKQLPQFGTMPDGQPVDHYRLENGAFAVEVLSLGGVIYRLEVPDRNNRAGNVVLNVPTVEAMLSPKSSYLGALIGRFANRIGFGRFALEGETYELAINDPPHCLHGGKVGYDKRIWTIKPHASPDGPALELSLVDEGGTENFPGTVKVTVIYTLLIDGLRISYRATSDQPTPINLTNHSYFNLKDAGRSSVLDHVVQLQA